MKSRVSEKILEDAEKTVQEIQKDLVRKERELFEAHQLVERKLREQLDAELEERVATEVNRLLAMTGLELKKERLQAKTEMVERVLDRCRTEIRNNRDLYLRFLKAMVVKGAISGEEEVILSEEDIHGLGPEVVKELNRAVEEQRGLAGHLRLAASQNGFNGGLILRDGLVTFNASLDQAVRTVAENRKVALVKTLFPKG